MALIDTGRAAVAAKIASRYDSKDVQAYYQMGVKDGWGGGNWAFFMNEGVGS